jgi:hypothetical protein
MATIYSKWDMINAVDGLKTALSSRDFIDPEVTVSISTTDWRPSRLEVNYKVRPDSTTVYKTFYGEEAHDVEKLVEEARTYITALKSRTELEHEEFMLMLGRVMDRAKDMGMDEDFVNPLTSMMKKLASNAIEYLK